MQQETEIAAGDLRLLGYNLTRAGQSQYIGDPSALPLRPGEVLHLTLFWQAVDKPQSEAEVTLGVLDRAGREVWNYRSALSGGLYPLRLWEEGEIVRDQHYLFLPGDLAPGDYRLLLGLNDLPSGRESLSPRLLRSLFLR
jgi:hypothetical protein